MRRVSEIDRRWQWRCAGSDTRKIGDYFASFMDEALDAWYSTFDVKPGQKEYLAPADRVKIW